jgi:two-component system, OmpR family, phosphate regulon sensor histidine kinase PhoR
MRLNLQYKITLLIAIVFAIVLTGVFLFLNQSLHHDYLSHIETDLEKKASLAKLYLERLPAGSLKSQSDLLADEIGKTLALRVSVISEKGILLGDSELDAKGLLNAENHSNRPEVQDVLKTGEGKSVRYSSTIKKMFLYAALGFFQDGQKYIIRLAVPLSELQEISSRLKRLLYLSLLFAFVLSLLLGFVASKIISRPLEELSQTAKSIAQGDFSQKLTWHRADEMGALSQSINEMVEQMKLRIAEVMSNKSRLEAVFLSMFEGVMILDDHQTILLMNDRLREFLNVVQEPTGRRSIEIIRNIDVQNIIEKVLKLSKPLEPHELSVFLPEERILFVHATPVIREKKVEGAVLVFQDINELRRLEKIRQDFVANVSHELRTPVSTIKGYAETLLDGALDDQKHAREFVKIIYDDSERLAHLVNDLLDLSKIESGKIKLNAAPCSLFAIVDKVTSALQKIAKEKSIVFKNTIPKNFSAISADQTMLTQVFFNLVENAIKYNKLCGEVLISAGDKGSHIEVRVADTGMGIPEEDLPRVFERFYRVDKAHSRQLGGTGLGLSIVKHIIQAHGGEVFVESKLNEGSIFVFTLPK